MNSVLDTQHFMYFDRIDSKPLKACPSEKSLEMQIWNRFLSHLKLWAPLRIQSKLQLLFPSNRQSYTKPYLKFQRTSGPSEAPLWGPGKVILVCNREVPNQNLGRGHILGSEDRKGPSKLNGYRGKGRAWKGLTGCHGCQCWESQGDGSQAPWGADLLTVTCLKSRPPFIIFATLVPGPVPGIYIF